MLTIIAPELANVSYILQNSSAVSTAERNNVTVYTRQYKGVTFMVVVSGYGKVNIARALEYATTINTVDKIISTGTASSTNPYELRISDVAVSKNAFQHDMDFSALGASIATLPEKTTGIYEADNDLVEQAELSAITLSIPYSTVTFATGDSMGVTESFSHCLVNRYDAFVAESDAGSIGEYAYFSNIPWVSVKGTASYCGRNAACDYKIYCESAMLKAQKIVLNMIA